MTTNQHYSFPYERLDAWHVARRAQAIYGGQVREYLRMALVLAWDEALSDPVVQECRKMIAEARAQRRDPQYRQPPPRQYDGGPYYIGR